MRHYKSLSICEICEICGFLFHNLPNLRMKKRGNMSIRMRSICLVVMLAATLAACSSGGGREAEIATSTAPPLPTDGPALEQVAPATAASAPSEATDEAYPPPPPPAPTAVEGEYPPPPATLPPPWAYPDPVEPSAQQNRLIEAAARDLNVQTDVPVDEIELVSAEAIVWPNGGLGCPEAGMNYVEVQVEGMVITLRAGGNEFTYHTDGSSQYVLCRDGVRISSGNVP